MPEDDIFKEREEDNENVKDEEEKREEDDTSIQIQDEVDTNKSDDGKLNRFFSGLRKKEKELPSKYAENQVKAGQDDGTETKEENEEDVSHADDGKDSDAEISGANTGEQKGEEKTEEKKGGLLKRLFGKSKKSGGIEENEKIAASNASLENIGESDEENEDQKVSLDEDAEDISETPKEKKKVSFFSQFSKENKAISDMTSNSNSNSNSSLDKITEKNQNSLKNVKEEESDEISDDDDDSFDEESLEVPQPSPMKASTPTATQYLAPPTPGTSPSTASSGTPAKSGKSKSCVVI